MAHRLESIAIGPCRRLLGRGGGARSHRASCGPPPRRDYASTTSAAASDRPRPTRTTPSPSPRVRPATAAPSSPPPMLLAGRYRREYHATAIARDDDDAPPPAPSSASASSSSAVSSSSRTGESIVPFASPKVEALFQKIIWLDMIEVHLLAELINEKMGITISDAERERMARGGGGGRGGGRRRTAEEDDESPVEAVVEKTSFDLKLIGFDAKNKIKVIKEVRAMTSLGLKEAKELVEGVPATLKKDIKREEAEELKVLLEGLGAQVDIV
ncbi:hypothetical protein ACHAW5_005845 [Stephanodiscus triporus]|uniref:Large ribosomal subunit protein bL12 C-terminal domain-containing protein n=1 Tax=Stephanodiscus triporus TaxID=2934178 RepID=A0ABD3MXK2_9STRA